MSLLAELSTILGELSIRSETGVFSGIAPDTYVVLTPVSDRYDVFADNRPEQDVEEVRISLYTRGNYRFLKRRIERALLSDGITVTITAGTISGNSAGQNGGVFYAGSGAVTVGAVTMSGNSAGNNGGVAWIGSGATALNDTEMTSNSAIPTTSPQRAALSAWAALTRG